LLDFGHTDTLSNYTRHLDTFNGIATVSYTYSGQVFRCAVVHGPRFTTPRLTADRSREYLASFPANVLAIRLSAPESTGQVTVKVSLIRSQALDFQTASIDDGVNSVKLRGSSTVAGIRFASEARVVNSGGEHLLDSLA